MVNETLKCDGQWSNSMYALAMLINFLRHIAFLTYFLGYFYNNLFRLEVNKLLHFTIALVNSSSQKGFHFVVGLFIISLSKSKSTSQLWAELKKEWSACQRSSSSIYRWPLYWMASIARSFYFLTQFISFQGLHFFICNFLNF